MSQYEKMLNDPNYSLVSFVRANQSADMRISYSGAEEKMLIEAK
jgi:hypothetical protein